MGTNQIMPHGACACAGKEEEEDEGGGVVVVVWQKYV